MTLGKKQLEEIACGYGIYALQIVFGGRIRICHILRLFFNIDLEGTEHLPRSCTACTSYTNAEQLQFSLLHCMQLRKKYKRHAGYPFYRQKFKPYHSKAYYSVTNRHRIFQMQDCGHAECRGCNAKSKQDKYCQRRYSNQNGTERIYRLFRRYRKA